MKRILVLFLISFFITLSACSVLSSGSESALSETAEPNPLRPVVTDAANATDTKNEQFNSSALPSTVNELDGEVSITATQPVVLGSKKTSTPISTEIPQICSPFDYVSSAELFEIVAAPYAPPPPGKEQRHHGVDFAHYNRGERTTIQGVGIQSVFPGFVAMAVADTFPYGNAVIIETPADRLSVELKDRLSIEDGQSLYLLYAHMDKVPFVALRDVIPLCESLGVVGKSGNADIPHLHLEARIGPQGTLFEGMAYYSTKTTAEERANYELWRTSGEFVHFDPMILFQP